MINFIKFSSLIIILLFFPISFYFNVISINCNSENDFQVKVDAGVNPEGYGNSTRWYAYISNFFLERNNEPLIIEDIDWGELHRNGNIIYVDIQIKKFRSRTVNEEVWPKTKFYEIGILEDGDYTLIIYVNGKKCYSENFYAVREIKLEFHHDFTPSLIWNGEEWIAEFEICANMVPKGIHWGPLIETEDGFLINIGIDEWIGPLREELMVFEKRNYSLGILPEGSLRIDIYVNGEFDTFCIYDISRTITTYVLTTYTTTEVYTNLLGIITIETIVEAYEMITSTIKVKEKIEKTETSLITTKTFQTSQTFKETKREEFKIEQYIIPIFLLIITIFTTIILYFILYRRKRI